MAHDLAIYTTGVALIAIAVTALMVMMEVGK